MHGEQYETVHCEMELKLNGKKTKIRAYLDWQG